MQAASVRSLPTALQGIGHGNVTTRAAWIQSSSDEAMVWQDSPSLVLLSGSIIKYALLTIAAVATVESYPALDLGYLPAICLGFALLRLLIRVCVLRSTRYRMSSQRLVIDAGVFNRVSVPYELHHLGDAVIHSPLLLRLFGRGNLNIVGQPIRLIGVRNPEAVRDLLRNAGQREAERMDKIRWR